MFRSILFISSVLFLTASAYECNGTSTIEAPSDISQPKYFPAGWSEDQPIPEVAQNQGCFITVNVPYGTFATVNFYTSFGQTGSCYVLYPNNDYKISTSIYLHFSKVQNHLSTAAQLGLIQTKFAFKVIWSQYPDTHRNVIDVYKGKPPVVVNANNNLTTFRGDVNSLISLVAFSLPDPSMSYLLRQSAIYAGSDFNGEFCGTLEHVISSQVKLVTYKNLLSVYTFGLNQILDYPLFLSQDFYDTTNYPLSYTGANCPSTGNCNVTLNGRMGSSITITDFNGPEIIKDFTLFPDTTIINVYENSFTNTTLVASLTNLTYKSQLPIEVKGTLKYYSLVGLGNVQMVITRDTSRANRL